MTCDHGDVFWQLDSCTEAGWKCLDCDETLGFRPDLDRSHTEVKVHCILFDLHHSKLIYLSNGTMGEIVTANVANRCRAENRYDQYGIIKFIIEEPNMAIHDGTFWRTRAERFLSGAEPIRPEQEAIPF